MKTVAIFVLCFLAMTQATRTVSGVVNFLGFPLNLSQKRSIMTLLTQVEALMKNGGPLDQITKMLNEFKDAIVNEQVAHDNLYEKQQAECGSEKEFREKEISDATASFKSAQEIFDGCTAQQARARADLNIAKTQYSDNLGYQVIVEETEKTAKDFYNQNVEQTKLVITALEEALVILEEYFQGESSFVQLTQHANKMLKLAVNVKKAAYLAPILGAFVQLANKQEDFDDIIAKRIKGLINDLHDQFTDFLEKLVEDGDARVAKYNEEIERVKAVISSLETDINDLSFEIAQLDKCIVNNTGIMSSAQAKIDRNQRLLDDADNLCEACVVEYEQATKARKGELKLLNALRERVEARFGQLGSGVTSRGMTDKEDFKYNAENDYDHQTFTPSN